MQIRYYKEYSRYLNRDMEFKVYGHAGRPILIFPARAAAFLTGKTATCATLQRPGLMPESCRSSRQTALTAKAGTMTAPRAPRIEMQERWCNYVCEELTPRALEINREQGPDHMGKVLVGGASMGAGHAVNLFLRRPDLYNGTIALSGLYQADMFFKGYMDDLVYRNSPCDYMRNFPDNHPYKELYAKADKFIMCCGQGQWEEELLRSTLQLRDILESKDIHPIVDIWGQDVSHDWYWWEKQWVYFLEMTLGKA